MEESVFTILATGLFLLLLGILVRLIQVLPCCHMRKHATSKRDLLLLKNATNKKKCLMVLLGSGGHTGEMLRILEQWSTGINNLHREYVISSGDSTSVLKLKKFEDNLLGNNAKDYGITTIYRARNIGEGKIKAVINTLLSFKSTLINLILSKLKNQPDVFLTNGPGTAIPIAYMLFILKLFGLCSTKIIYVESLARVKELSLTGFLILPISDRIIVQWEPLAKRYRRCEYYGILV